MYNSEHKFLSEIRILFNHTTTMKNVIFTLLPALVFLNCRNTCEQLSTTQISVGLYLERYKTYNAGVWGELIECYITDSLTFRTRIGSYDEHGSFFAKLDGDKIIAYNTVSSFYPDTTERKSISRKQLLQTHQIDKDCITSIPLFGPNLIKCDSIVIPFDSYKNEDGYYISQVQHQCKDDYLNAVYFTDSSRFSIFIGVRDPGSRANNYSVRLDRTDTFIFYNVENKYKVDTVRSKIYLLRDLKKEKLIRVCN